MSRRSNTGRSIRGEIMKILNHEITKGAKITNGVCRGTSRSSRLRGFASMKPFLEAIDERVLVCDGAMGTMLYAKGVFINRCFDALNLTDPSRVAEVHQRLRARRRRRHRDEYLRRQSHQAARLRPGDRLRDINVEGARLARAAAGGQAYVAGAIGPLGIRIEPWGKTGKDEAEGLLPRAGGGAAGRRRRSVRPRDVSRPHRASRGDRGDSRRLRPADRRADDD